MEPKLIGYWVHSPNKDSDGILVYSRRNNDTKKPLHDSFELKPDGEFLKYKLSSEGRLSVSKGRFDIKDHFIYVNFDNPYQDFIFNIIYYDDDLLKVRK